MSTVTLSIGPKTYAVACADGQEAHITALGAIIAEKYAQLGTARAPLEAQNLVFAALFLADELAEARKQAADAGAIAGLEDEVARLDAALAAEASKRADEASTIAALQVEVAQRDAALARGASKQAADAAAIDALKADIAQLQIALASKASAPPPAPEPNLTTPQIDLFGARDSDPLLAERLEALAERAEASAAALEAIAPTA